MPPPPHPPPPLSLSVVAPAHNEEDNVIPLVEQVHAALAPSPASPDFEMIIVDDGSTDRTLERLRSLLPRFPFLRILKMLDTPPGRGHGQSAAFKAGFRAAQGRLIAVLDADLQNDPADLPAMLRLMEETGADMVQGDRSHARQDHFGRRVGSAVGRACRAWLLKDTIRDTGCSLRIMRREVALAVPLEFKGMHRFIPVTARQLGYHVVEMPVRHRPRAAGQAKYGTFNRALPGLFDTFAVRWMTSRRRPTEAVEVEALPQMQSNSSSGVISTASLLSDGAHVGQFRNC